MSKGGGELVGGGAGEGEGNALVSKKKVFVQWRLGVDGNDAEGMARTGQIPGGQRAHVGGTEQVPVWKGFSHGGNGKP
mgnify:CR=1 FL=1